MDNLNKQANAWVQTNEENPNNGQTSATATAEQERLSQLESSYKSLESEYTKARQLAIDIAIKASQKDAKSILEISDKKVQDAVVRNIYGYESLAQLQSIEWHDFYEVKSWDDVSELDKLSKEVKMLRYSSEAKELDSTISNYKLRNPELFTWNNAEALIKEELKYISSELPMDERVKRAATNVLGSQYDPTSLAYKAIATASAVKNSNQTNTNDWVTKTQLEDKQDSLREFWGLPKQK